MTGITSYGRRLIKTILTGPVFAAARQQYHP
jgi:hypothetical protein